MDYFKLLKRAWDITWRYKALWVLGLFVGVASSGSSAGNMQNSFSDGGEEFSSSMNQVTSWASEHVVMIAVLVAIGVVISTALWVLSVAAQGGIAYGTNEAAEDRAPSLGVAWSAGFAKWGRTFMVQFVLGLPLLVVLLLSTGLALAFGLTAFADGGGAAILGICLLAPVLLVVITVGSLIIGILSPVAVRYGVLQDVTYGQAIKRAWDDLWGKKGLVIFWLVMLLPGFAYGLAVGAIALVMLIPAGVALFAEQYIIAGALFFLMALVLMVPNAIYATFVHAAWTLMFRHIAGMEPLPTAAYTPPAAPSDWAPAPAPPVIPASPEAPGPTSAPLTPPPPPGTDV